MHCDAREQASKAVDERLRTISNRDSFMTLHIQVEVLNIRSRGLFESLEYRFRYKICVLRHSESLYGSKVRSIHCISYTDI